MSKKKKTNLDKRLSKNTIFNEIREKYPLLDDRWIKFREVAFRELEKVFYELEISRDKKNIQKLCEYIQHNRYGDPLVWIGSVFYYYLRKILFCRSYARKYLSTFFGINADNMNHNATIIHKHIAHNVIDVESIKDDYLGRFP